jgi:outer membrane protein OmpA-like peptidoglycan-associated protein
MMKRFLLFLIAVPLLLLGACAPPAHFGVPDRALLHPSDFQMTEAAIAASEKAPGAKYCPDKIAKAKEMAKKGIETYWACRDAEGLKMLADARKLAKEAEACQPPPPPPPPPPAKKEISLKWVYFDFDKATLTAQAKAILDETVKILKDNPEINLELAGHTDAIGTDAYNVKLSQRRSKAVNDYLVSKGIPQSRLKMAGYGEAKPVADNKTADGRAKNRRVELKIIK